VKTETTTRVPLLPQALKIMNEYKDHPQCVNRHCHLEFYVRLKVRVGQNVYQIMMKSTTVLTFNGESARVIFVTILILQIRVFRRQRIDSIVVFVATPFVQFEESFISGKLLDYELFKRKTLSHGGTTPSFDSHG
jgi:hypothetical protein